MSGPVEVGLESGLLRITLAGVRGNVLDGAMVRALRATLREHAADPRLRAVLLCARGPHFCYGASVEEHRPEKAPAMLAELHGLLRDLLGLGVPCLGAVRGACLGGGLELALCCTFLVAAPDAHFGFPEIKLGHFAPFASALLPWRIGLAHAERLLVSGEPVDAERAFAIGLVDDVADEPEAGALLLYEERLAPRSGSSLRLALRAAREQVRPRLEEALQALERLYVQELLPTHDAREGIEAFLEKRAPRWENR